MKIVLMAALALLFLGGGAGGAYFLLAKPAEASANAMSEHEVAQAAKAQAERDAKLNAIFVELSPLILPIVDNNGVSQTISLVISVEVTDEAAAAIVRNMQPRLQDAFIHDMYGALSRKAVMNGGVIEVAKIKQRLGDVCQNVMGENVIKEVLLQVVQQRRV